MKEGWKYSTIEECCNVNYGTRVVRSEVTGDKYPVYGGGGETFRMDEYNREDCLVVSRFAMSKQCTRIVKGKFYLNDSGLTVSPKPTSGLLPTLLDRYLLASNDIIYSFGRGSAQRNLNMVEFRKLKISYPISLSEQQKIVEYLDATFAKIETMKANAEKALNEAKALFQSSLKELLEQEWDYVNFKDIFPIKMGKTPPRGDKSSWDVKKETQNKWVSIADISNNEGKIINDTKEYISNSAANKIFKVSKGSLLMSFKLSIGRMAFAGDDLYTNEAIIAIPESEKYLLRFLFYYLSSYNWLSLTEGNEKVKGATLNKTSIGTIQLPVLSVTQQQSIVNTLDSIKSRVDQLQANYDKISQECDALKQSILKQVFE